MNARAPHRGRAFRRAEDVLAREAFYSPWTPTEAEFTELFLAIASTLHWERRYHTYDSRRSPGGFPDWVLVHPGQRRVLFVELKGFGGLVSDEQRAWIGDLDAAGAEAYIVRTTNDYAQDAHGIAQLLRERPPRVPRGTS